MCADKTMDGRGPNGRYPGTGGYQPSLPSLAAGDQIPGNAIGDQLERRIRSATTEADEARALLRRFQSSSSGDVLAACRKFLDDRYRLQSEIERLSVETADHGRHLTRIARVISLVYKRLGGEERVSMGGVRDPSSIAHVDLPERPADRAPPSVPVPDAEILARTASAAAVEALGPAVAAAVQDAVAEAFARMEERMSLLLVETVRSAVAQTVPATAPEAASSSVPDGQGRLAVGEEKDEKPEKEKKTYGSLPERAAKNGTFGRSHPDFKAAAILAVELVEKSSFPLSAKVIGDHIRAHIDTFQISQKDIGNRLNMMGLVRLKRMSGGATGFWYAKNPTPVGWTI